MAKNIKLRVPNISKSSDPLVYNPIKAQTERINVWFDFQNVRWMSSVKFKDFSNYVSSSDECLEKYYTIFNEIVPKVQIEWDKIVKKQGYYPHCHALNGKAEELARSVFQQIYDYPLDEGQSLWQFGFTQSTRLICIHNHQKNAMIPIFVDHNHLLYPNKWHNHNDYENYTICMHCYNKRA